MKSTKTIVVTCALVVIALVVQVGLIWWGVDRWTSGSRTQAAAGKPKTATPENARALPYSLQPALEVEPGHVFTIPIGFDPNQFATYRDSLLTTEIVMVYSDETLTRRAEFYVDERNGALTIMPPPLGKEVNVAHSERQVKLFPDSQWGLFETYYLTQYVDAKTGERLAKPLVTPFTVKNALPAPDADVRVDDDGNVVFSWDPIDGASGYHIVRAYLPSAKARNLHYQIIGETVETTWSSKDDLASAKNRQWSKKSGYTAGSVESFREYHMSEDDRHSGVIGGLTTEDDLKDSEYGVIAKVGERLSPYRPIVGSRFISQVPVEEANVAAREMGVAGVTSLKRISEIPTLMPVTMADGRTVLRPVIPDPETVSADELVVAKRDPRTGRLRDKRKVRAAKVKYKIAGTPFFGYYSFAHYSVAKAKAELEPIVQRNVEAKEKAGFAGAFAYQSERKDLSTVRIVKEAPASRFPATGSNSFALFLAKHLVAGSEYIDVSDYVDLPGAPRPRVAFDEAIRQNPFVPEVRNYVYYEDKGIVEVGYAKDKAGRDEYQNAIKKALDAAATTLNVAGKSDKAKALAINQYLADTAEYDYVALREYERHRLFVWKREPFLAYGVLVDKTGVCASYAAGFKALADAVGLEAVVVHGVARRSGEGHAWNKVKIDGKWYAFDPTWNDSKVPNRYVGLTDAQMNKDHEEQEITDPLLLDSYRTPDKPLR